MGPIAHAPQRGHTDSSNPPSRYPYVIHGRFEPHAKLRVWNQLFMCNSTVLSAVAPERVVRSGAGVPTRGENGAGLGCSRVRGFVSAGRRERPAGAIRKQH